MGGFNAVTGMVKGLIKDLNITVEVAIHLDHGQSFENCKKALDAGFTSVMIDGSHHPIDENIRMTKEVVDYAHAMGASVEAEVGTVGGNEDGVIGGIKYADLNECVRLVKEAGVDALAPALGSVHGPYQGEPVLGFDEMEAIGKATDMPLVLHGGTGIPDEMIKKAIYYQESLDLYDEANEVLWFVRDLIGEMAETINCPSNWRDIGLRLAEKYRDNEWVFDELELWNYED